MRKEVWGYTPFVVRGTLPQPRKSTMAWSAVIALSLIVGCTQAQTPISESCHRYIYIYKLLCLLMGDIVYVMFALAKFHLCLYKIHGSD